MAMSETGKDTVSNDDENDKVGAVQHAFLGAPVRLNAVVHHFVPIFTG